VFVIGIGIWFQWEEVIIHVVFVLGFGVVMDVMKYGLLL
jgi:hypothetical protein